MKIVIGNIIFLAALILILARFISVWAGTPFPIDLVTSDSMSPTLMKGDVVAWTPTKIENVKVGDVVVFKSYVHWPEEKILVHRVVDIKQDSRGTYLKTKGDANDRVDQVGIPGPEGPIREDHLMGKVVSIGQTPLKIPLVGIIGIWINDGVASLAQPTSSKGSLSYLGIFAPLTISVIILVVLLFLIPEKGKTIKEKIRFHRFGPGQLDLKKTLAVFLVVYFVFFSMIHLFAYDSVTTSVGINDGSQSSQVDFKRIKQGTESLPQELPLINPSVSNVKGIIFARGEVKDHISKKVFELKPGAEKSERLIASASNTSKNGSYMGEIMVYSSPFWAWYPDDIIQKLVSWDAEKTVYCLDFFTALILTAITGSILIIITIISRVYNVMSIDLSWRFAPRTILKKQTIKKMGYTKVNIKKSFSKKIGWIIKTDLAEIDIKGPEFKSFIKPILAALIVLPILFIFNDGLIAMIIAVIIAGVIAYSISCKIRTKIILTALVTMSIATAYMIIQSNLVILEKQNESLVTLSYLMGATGIYLLVFGLILVPLSLLSWFIVRRIRNLKERREPLLMLEGKCDL